MAYAMDPYEQRVELPSVQEVFYGPREPTFLIDTDPYYQRRPHMLPPPAYVHARDIDPVYRTRDIDPFYRTRDIDPFYRTRDIDPFYRTRDIDPVYRTRALVAPSSTRTHVVPVNGSVNNFKTHPKGLVLSVPMCCDKCVGKVRRALDDLEGVRDVILDQYNQLVTIHGDVDPEKALRRVRRVKKRSKFWRMATQPIQYSGSPATGYVHSKSLVNAYSAPSYHTSAYRAPSSAYSQYLNPPRYTSSYSRAYSSPYIDSAYRSGYVEPRGVYGPYGRFAHDDLEYRSRFDRGTPYLQMNDI